jgi:hypothetical protein
MLVPRLVVRVTARRSRPVPLFHPFPVRERAGLRRAQSNRVRALSEPRRSGRCPVPGSRSIAAAELRLPGILFSLVKKDPHHRRGSFFRSRRGSFPGKDEQTGFSSLGPRRAQTDSDGPRIPYLHSAIKMWFRQDQFFAGPAAFDLSPARGGTPIATRTSASSVEPREPVEMGAPLTPKAPAGRQSFLKICRPHSGASNRNRALPNHRLTHGGKRSDTPLGFIKCRIGIARDRSASPTVAVLGAGSIEHLFRSTGGPDKLSRPPGIINEVNPWSKFRGCWRRAIPRFPLRSIHSP